MGNQDKTSSDEDDQMSKTWGKYVGKILKNTTKEPRNQNGSDPTSYQDRNPSKLTAYKSPVNPQM